MRKLYGSMIIALLFASLLVVATAKAADDARVYYDKGVKVEAPSQGFDVKLNTWIAGWYAYQANDGAEDTSGFDIYRARLIFSGNALDKQVSYFLQADFVGATDDGSDGEKSASLKDAWISWNACETNKLRFGQWKTPFTRQYPLSDQYLMFPKVSFATGEFNLGRNVGLGLYGNGDGWEYGAGVFNGNSDGEGENFGPKDTKLAGMGYAALTSNYKRNGTTESDLEMTEGMGWTAGASVAYQQAQGEVSEGVTDEGDSFALSGDLGLKSAGLAVQGEIFYRSTDLDQTDYSSDDLGYYVQAGYFLVPKDLELAGRFSAVNFDAEEEDVYEYSIFLNKYIMGNNLKVLTGVTFEDTSVDEGEDTLDTRYEIFVSGYF